MSEESGFLRESIGENAMEMFEMTVEDLEYYINLLDKAVADSEKIDSNLKRSSTVGNMLSNSTYATEKFLFNERKNQLMQQISLLSYF